jgi:methylated-DNA-[protein]-cysteine S-methyltransferase
MHFPADTVRSTTMTPLGELLLAASSQGLAGLWFSGQRHAPDASRWPVQPKHLLLQQAVAEINDYFSGQRRTFSLPLDTRLGTAFQQAVWAQLRRIPPGHTVSYGEIARGIGQPTAVRAVGAAVGRNPWSVVVPCHRVLGAQGALTGYAGGLDRKIALLQLEGVAV